MCLLIALKSHLYTVVWPPLGCLLMITMLNVHLIQRPCQNLEFLWIRCTFGNSIISEQLKVRQPSEEMRIMTDDNKEAYQAEWDESSKNQLKGWIKISILAIMAGETNLKSFFCHNKLFWLLWYLNSFFSFMRLDVVQETPLALQGPPI